MLFFGLDCEKKKYRSWILSIQQPIPNHYVFTSRDYLAIGYCSNKFHPAEERSNNV